MFLYSRVPSEKSFFNFNSSNWPQCINETYNVIQCSCAVKTQGDITLCNEPIDPGSISVPEYDSPSADTCVFLKPNTSIVQNLQNVLANDLYRYTTPLPTNHTSLIPVSNISTIDAWDWCDRIFHLTPAYNICSSFVNIIEIREACITDIQVLLFHFSM